MRWLKPCIALTLAAGSYAQAPEGAKGARELYYFGSGRKDQLPSLQKVSTGRSAAQQSASNTAPPRQGRAPADAEPAPAALNLGLRYNLLLVDSKSGRTEPVDPDRVFQKGDCLSMEFDSNRSGYLYVLAKQSSGDWLPLVPSPQISNEPNIIDPGQKLRAPRGYCFEISDPPGAESIFVVLSRDPRDFFELYQGIKNQPSEPGSPPASRPIRNSSTVQVASAGMVNSAVSKMATSYNRDLVIRKVAVPVDSNEAPNSVYVVNASDKPASTISTQFQIKHR